MNRADLLTGKVGTIGRFKPLHKGAQSMLETLCEQADEVIIGIGSSNKYDMRNPFTAEETGEMISRALHRYDNFTILYVPDFGHLGPEHHDGQSWRRNVIRLFGNLDYFVSGNEYVKELLESDYDVIHPDTIVPEEKKYRVSGTQVRIEMARGGRWDGLVSGEVAEYLSQKKNPHSLIGRFREEFGKETLQNKVGDLYNRKWDIEYQRTLV